MSTKKIKIIIVHCTNTYGDYEIEHVAKPFSADWEEVSDEDFQLLREWIRLENGNRYQTNQCYVILEECRLPAVKELIAKASSAVRSAAEKKREKELKEKERREKIESKKRDLEKKKIKQLLQKFTPDDINAILKQELDNPPKTP
jgi:hypothetical protein